MFFNSETNPYMSAQSEEESLNARELARIQEKFCKLAGIYGFCVNATGQMLTNYDCGESEVRKIKEYIDESSFGDAFLRLKESPLEDQIVEDTQYSNLKYAVLAIRVNQQIVVSWVVVAVLSDMTAEGDESCVHDLSRSTTEDKFYISLDLVRIMTNKLLNAREQASEAVSESRRSLSTQQEMSESLRRVEAMTEALQYLEKDDAIEAICLDVLRVAGSYLKISNAVVLKVHKDDDLMDVVAEWCNTGMTSLFDQTRNIHRFPMLKYDRPLILSSDAKVTDDEREIMRRMYLRAMVALPIEIKGSVGMYVCYNECRSDKLWTVDEIRFMNDITRILQSIIDRKIQRNSIAGSYQSMLHILDNVGSSIFVKDIETGNILLTNTILRASYEKEIREGMLDEIYKDVAGNATQKGSFDIERSFHGKWFEIHCTCLKWLDNRPVILCVIYDVTDKKLYQNRIEQQAYTDFLTGLYNRMCCERDLAVLVDSAKEKHTQGTLLYLDLDNFKHVNDGLGHQYGDVLLKAIAHSLQRIEGITNSCYRMGGDEFVIIIPPDVHRECDRIVKDIQDVFSRPWYLKNSDYYCTMSMGTVDFPEEGESVSELIKKADMAMYEAKKSGKNRVAHYSENIGSFANRRLNMEKNMRAATVNGYREFEVYYQPIVDVRVEGYPCTGAEALIRWNSSEFGFMSPSEFIPLAEYLGLINPIGNFVLLEACRECRRWNENGHPHYKVNVNLSVVQLLQNDIIGIVKDALEQTGINPQNLTLEVTESLAINDIDKMKRILNSIRELGVRIALDDFGTGYSSLSHIRELPLDVIKIDQSFVKNIGTDDYSESLVNMVAELASILDVNVCVEGVETTDQLERVSKMKISLIQGYYFDKPMKVEEFEDKYVLGVPDRMSGAAIPPSKQAMKPAALKEENDTAPVVTDEQMILEQKEKYGLSDDDMLVVAEGDETL